MENSSIPNKSYTAHTIGRAAASRRNQLAQLKAAEKRRQEAYRMAREELARELALLEAQERQARRDRERRERRRVEFCLGALVLEALIVVGIDTDVTVTCDSLASLKAADFELLLAVLTRLQGAEHQSKCASISSVAPQDVVVDILL